MSPQRANLNPAFHAREAADHLAIASERAERVMTRLAAADVTDRDVTGALAASSAHQELASAHALVAIALSLTGHRDPTAIPPP